MAKRKRDLNTVYISERLRESLRPISRCALTTVVAPMGYGKTTAVNWYLAEHAGAEAVKIVRINVYSDNLAIFWRSVQDAFARAGFDMLRDYPCPVDAAGGIHRAWIVPQHIKAGAGKGVLNASPEYGQIVRIHVDPDDLHGLRSGVLGQIPVHRRGLTVAHGRHHSGQRATGNRPQTLPQPLRYINGIQIPFPLCHGSPPDRFVGEPHPQPPPAAQRMVR